jgi:hypothetical protein
VNGRSNWKIPVQVEKTPSILLTLRACVLKKGLTKRVQPLKQVGFTGHSIKQSLIPCKSFRVADGIFLFDKQEHMFYNKKDFLRTCYLPKLKIILRTELCQKYSLISFFHIFRHLIWGRYEYCTD